MSGIIIPIVDISTQPEPVSGKMLVSIDSDNQLKWKDSDGNVYSGSGSTGSTGTPSQILYFGASGSIFGDDKFTRSPTNGDTNIGKSSGVNIYGLEIDSFYADSADQASLIMLDTQNRAAISGVFDMSSIGGTGPGSGIQWVNIGYAPTSMSYVLAGDNGDNTASLKLNTTDTYSKSDIFMGSIGISASMTVGSFSHGFQAIDHLDILELLTGATSIGGVQMKSTYKPDGINPSAVGVNWIGYEATTQKYNIASMVADDSGSAACIQVWDINHDRWHASLTTEHSSHNVRNFITSEAGQTGSEVRAEIETFDNIAEEKCNLKVYYNNTTLEYHWGITYSIGLSIYPTIVSIGNYLDVGKGTYITIDDDISKINFKCSTASVNGNMCFSGTYSADGQIVTVENGFITSVS